MAKMTSKKTEVTELPGECGCDTRGQGGAYQCGCEGGEMKGYYSSPGRVFLKVSAGILMLVLAIGAGMQIWGNPWYKNIRAEFTSTPYARTVTVEGDGKVTVKPDIARISLSVASTGKTVKEATTDNTQKMNAVIGELKNLGIKPEDMQTSSYNLYPTYDYEQNVYQKSLDPAQLVSQTTVNKAPKIVGYTLNQTIDLKVRDLTKTDEVIDRGTKAGANQIGSLMFDVDDVSVPKAEARKLAFDKAKAKVAQMAGAAGVNIGRVVTFSEGYSGGMYSMQYATNYATRDMAAGSPVPTVASVEPGSQEITVNVSVTYEIE